MKRFVIYKMILLMIIGLFSAPSLCRAQNTALKQECETKTQQAADLIKTSGARDAFRRITSPDGPYVGKHTHVFCIDAENGTLLAHKVAQFVGFNMNNYRDADQNRPYTRILKLVRTAPIGWVSYKTYGAGPEKRDTAALKYMYYLKVPGENIVLCCGYWEDD